MIQRGVLGGSPCNPAGDRILPHVVVGEDDHRLVDLAQVALIDQLGMARRPLAHQREGDQHHHHQRHHGAQRDHDLDSADSTSSDSTVRSCHTLS
jgi:hypothetical protein